MPFFKVVVTLAACSMGCFTPAMASKYHLTPTIASVCHFTTAKLLQRAVGFVYLFTPTHASECLFTVEWTPCQTYPTDFR